MFSSAGTLHCLRCWRPALPESSATTSRVDSESASFAFREAKNLRRQTWQTPWVTCTSARRSGWSSSRPHHAHTRFIAFPLFRCRWDSKLGANAGLARVSRRNVFSTLELQLASVRREGPRTRFFPRAGRATKCGFARRLGEVGRFRTEVGLPRALSDPWSSWLK